MHHLPFAVGSCRCEGGRARVPDAARGGKRAPRHECRLLVLRTKEECRAQPLRPGRRRRAAAGSPARARTPPSRRAPRPGSRPPRPATVLAQVEDPRGAPGRTLALSRVRIPARTALALHRHPGHQIAYIERGTLTYTVRSGVARVFRGAADADPELVRTVRAGADRPGPHGRVGAGAPGRRALRRQPRRPAGRHPARDAVQDGLPASIPAAEPRRFTGATRTPAPPGRRLRSGRRAGAAIRGHGHERWRGQEAGVVGLLRGGRAPPRRSSVDRRRRRSRRRRPRRGARCEAAADGKLLFFAADGLRQDAVAQYADQGAVPGFRGCCAAARAPRAAGLLTQAPPNTGAGWFTLATGAWPGVAGSTNNTFHVNGAAVRQPHGRLRPRRAAGRDARPGGRARRQEGRPDRVGRRPQRRDRGPDARLPQLPLRPRRGHQLHRARRLGVVHRRLRPAVRPSRRLRRPGAVPAGRARRRRPAGRDVPRSYSPAQEMRLRVLDGSASTSTASTPTSTTAATTGGRATTACSSRPTKDGDDAVGDLARGRVGRRQGHDPGRRPRRQDGRDARQGRAARAPTSRRCGSSTPR